MDEVGPDGEGTSKKRGAGSIMNDDGTKIEQVSVCRKERGRRMRKSCTRRERKTYPSVANPYTLKIAIRMIMEIDAAVSRCEERTAFHRRTSVTPMITDKLRMFNYRVNGQCAVIAVVSHEYWLEWKTFTGLLSKMIMMAITPAANPGTAKTLKREDEQMSLSRAEYAAEKGTHKGS